MSNIETKFLTKVGTNYIDLSSIFQPYLSGLYNLNTGYNIAEKTGYSINGSDLNTIFAGYITGSRKTSITGYNNKSKKNLNAVFLKYFPPPTFSLTGTSNNVRITFTAPSSFTTEDITDYLYSINNEAFVSMGTTTSPYNITGLPNKSYTIKLKAKTALYEGLPSSSQSVTLYDVPSEPTNFEVTGLKDQMQFTFTVPSNDGNSLITGYFYCTDGSTFNKSFSPNISNNIGTYTFDIVSSGLTRGNYYDFAIKAKNAVGNGSPSLIINAQATTSALAPTKVFVGVVGSITKIYFKVNGTGGSAVVKYNIYNNNTITVITPINTSTISINGTSYTTAVINIINIYKVLGVQLETLYGNGNVSIDGDNTASLHFLNTNNKQDNAYYAAPVLTVPGNPTFTATPGDTIVTLSSITTLNNGGTDDIGGIINYKYSINSGSYIEFNGGELTVNQPNFIPFTISILAVNSLGDGLATIKNVMPGKVPIAPTITSFTAENYNGSLRFYSRATVVFTSSESTNTSYKIIISTQPNYDDNFPPKITSLGPPIFYKTVTTYGEHSFTNVIYEQDSSQKNIVDLRLFDSNDLFCAVLAINNFGTSLYGDVFYARFAGVN